MYAKLLAPGTFPHPEPAPKLGVAAGKQLVWPTVCVSRRRGLLGETGLGGDLRGSEHVPPEHRSNASTLSKITPSVFVSCSSVALSRRCSSSSWSSSAFDASEPETRTATRLPKTRGGMRRGGGASETADAVATAVDRFSDQRGDQNRPKRGES